MQQTDKYQLNLIETSDTFSPAPLNENMAKLEAAIAAGDAAEAQTRAAETAALDQRVQVLELHKFAAGRFIGDGAASRFIDLGFTPKFILYSFIKYPNGGGSGTLFCTPDWPVMSGDRPLVQIVPNGFSVFNANNYAANAQDLKYDYFAIC